MLPDWSNPEGVDPEPPLNWTRETFAGKETVVLYGIQGSPPFCKIVTCTIQLIRTVVSAYAACVNPALRLQT